MLPTGRVAQGAQGLGFDPLLWKNRRNVEHILMGSCCFCFCFQMITILFIHLILKSCRLGFNLYIVVGVCVGGSWLFPHLSTASLNLSTMETWIVTSPSPTPRCTALGLLLSIVCPLPLRSPQVPLWVSLIWNLAITASFHQPLWFIQLSSLVIYWFFSHKGVNWSNSV